MTFDDPFDAFDQPDSKVNQHLNYLRQARPWVFVAACITSILAATGLLFCVGFGLNTLVQLTEGRHRMAIESSVQTMILFVLSGLVGVLAMRMFQMANALTGLRPSTQNRAALRAFLKQNRNFWQLFGATTAIFALLNCGGFLLNVAEW
ncbi:MAG: hypothetical protein AAGA48_36760 [Myxococcota bacterium]